MIDLYSQFERKKCILSVNPMTIGWHTLGPLVFNVKRYKKRFLKFKKNGLKLKIRSQVKNRFWLKVIFISFEDFLVGIVVQCKSGIL